MDRGALAEWMCFGGLKNCQQFRGWIAVANPARVASSSSTGPGWSMICTGHTRTIPPPIGSGLPSLRQAGFSARIGGLLLLSLAEANILENEEMDDESFKMGAASKQRVSRRMRQRWARHHLPLAVVSGTAVAVLDGTRPYADWITRLSFATAYVALALLAMTLLTGPWNVLTGRRNPVSSDLRRDLGIWAGMLALVHSAVGQCVHLRGRPWLYYVYGPWEHGHWMPLRHDLFGFNNFTGLASAGVVALLLATSSDWALRRLGTPGWKRLQRWNYAAFALAAAHGIGYQTMEKQKAEFVAVLVACLAVAAGMQMAGFILRRAEQRRKLPGR